MSKLNFLNQITTEEKIIYNKNVVNNIIYVAISEIPYVELIQPTYFAQSKINKAVKIIFNGKNLSIDVVVKIHASQSISDTAFRIQEAIKHSIESMTEYVVNDVNVKVLDVIFDSFTPEAIDSAKIEKDSKVEETEEKDN